MIIDKYASFDYVGEVVNVELKTRRISYNQSIKYGDLIFSYSKYKKWLQNKKTSYIVWKLTDAMVYWKVHEISDNWITKDPFRCDGNENNSHIIHIPMDFIKTFWYEFFQHIYFKIKNASKIHKKIDIIFIYKIKSI